jgi:ribonuclease P protein component
VLVGRRDALSRDFTTMLDDLRIAFTKPARHTAKGPHKGPNKGRGSRPDSSPDPAASRKPD